MKEILELKLANGSIHKRMKEMAKKKPFTDEDQKTWDELGEDYDQNKKSIDRFNEYMHREAALLGAVYDPDGTGIRGKNFKADGHQLATRGWCSWKPAEPQNRDRLDDGGFRDLQDFLVAVRNVRGGKYDDRLERFEQRGQETVTGADGGFLLPPRYLDQVMMSAGDMEPWLQRRNMFRVDRQDLYIPRVDDGDRSSDEVGGLALSRVGEAGTIPEDKVVFKSTRIALTKASTLIPVSNELLMSGVGIEQTLTGVIGKTVALRQAADFIAGTGSGEPMGISVGSDLVSVTSSSAAGALALSELGGMLAKLDGGGNDSAAWLVHPSVITAMLAMTSAGGNNPLWMPDGREGVSSTLFGIPIFYTDACELLNAQGDIYLCNLDQYVYAWRGIIIDSSPDYKWNTDETTFRVRLYDDGMPLRDGTRTDRQSYTSANNVDLTVRS